MMFISRARGLRRTLALAVAVAAIFSAMMPAVALAKSFRIDDVAIEGRVSPNGTLAITEKRTVTFDGDFSRVYWNLRTTGSSGIEVVGVTDDRGVAYQRTEDPSSIDSRPEGSYYVEQGGSELTVHIFHRSADEQRSFTLSYRAAGAATRWADTGELNWQLLGAETAVPAKRFTADISVDGVGRKADMRAWAHGPLTGNVSITPAGAVHLAVDNVPANTFVEARMVFPASALSRVRPNSLPRLDTILAQEKELADSANRARAAARLTVALWVGLPSLLALGALALGIWAFLKYGREHAGGFQGQYFREDPRPDLHPAVVGALWRFGKVQDSDIAATLMNLADKGIVRMAPQTVEKGGISGLLGGKTETFSLERVVGKQVADPLDSQLLDLLFGTVGGGRDVIALTEMESYAKANPQTFTSELKAWKDNASAQAEQLGFFEPEGQSWQVGSVVMAVFIAALGVFGTVRSGSALAMLVTLPAAIALTVLAIFMRRRSTQGNELYRTYEAVRNFLKDFSRMKEAPPASVVLWNRFLVLAVIFGIAEQVIEALRVTLPDVVRDPGFQTSYWWVYAGSYGHSPVSSLSNSFVSAASVATSQMSSASGGGGGFSGGGGFGGGGGGFGAD